MPPYADMLDKCMDQKIEYKLVLLNVLLKQNFPTTPIYSKLFEKFEKKLLHLY